MKKTMFRVGGAVLTIAATILGTAGFSAFEGRTVNVTARIAGVSTVQLTEIDFSTVFPQEKLDKTFNFALSDDIIEQAQPTGDQFATSVESFTQGLRKDGSPVLPERSIPSHALGANQTTGLPSDPNPNPADFVSLGFGGEIILGFTNFIVNNGGGEIMDFEVTGGTYLDEQVDVYASMSATGPWTLLAAGAIRDEQIDMGSLPFAKFIRLVDTTPAGPFEPTADAFDLDAVKAINQEKLGNVTYHIRQKPKCVDDFDPTRHPPVLDNDDGTFSCPEGSTEMPLLCPFLSKHEISTDGLLLENDSAGINAFHGLPLPWTQQTAIDTEVDGMLSKPAGDILDTWNVDLRVPAFRGKAAQDWKSFVQTESGNPEIDADLYLLDPELEHLVFGCDLWLEVTSIE